MEYIKRELQAELVKWLPRPEILAIRGPRQSGKTTLLNQLQLHIKQKMDIPPGNILYISFEDKRETANFSKDPKNYIESYMSSNSKSKKFFFLLDEFQYIKDGGQKLKLLFDSYKNVKFIITGSSSLELSGKTIKYLVGRIFLFDLYQFNFKEFLKTKKANILNYYIAKANMLSEFIYKGKPVSNQEFSDIYTGELNSYFEEYCIYGGYPEAVKAKNAETKKIILENIFNTYISRDIIDLLRIEDDYTLKDIIALLANQTGKLVNYGTLSRDSKTYFKRLKYYLSILEETYIVYLLKPYFGNLASEIKKNPKIYFLDTGLRNTAVNNYNQLKLRVDSGSLAENAVFSNFLKRGQKELRYWRTIHKAEVDFVMKTENGLMPIEVKYSSLNSARTSRSFLSFINRYNPPRGLILTRGFWCKRIIENTTVLFVPIWFT
jgi:uncharacterized protein